MWNSVRVGSAVASAALLAFGVLGCDGCVSDENAEGEPAVTDEAEDEAEAPETAGDGETAEEPAEPDEVESFARPRYSPDGQQLVFHGGADGQRRIWVADADGSNREALTAGEHDDRDPDWGPDGDTIVFASDRSGDYDLYRIEPEGGEPNRVVDLEGDVVQPAVSPLRYTLYAVGNPACGGGPINMELDGYDKVLFTRKFDDEDRDEIWFSSMAPVDVDIFEEKLDSGGEVSDHGAHTGRVSPEGESCRQAQFAHNGRAATWTCDEGEGAVVLDNEAKWDQDFQTALAAIERGEGCEHGDGFEECFADLPHRYTRFEGPDFSSPGDEIRRAGVSANHTMLVGDADGEGLYRNRFHATEWGSLNEQLEIDRDGVRNVAWSPDGSRIAFDYADDETRQIGTAQPDFYLQDVRNLDEFSELRDDQRSDRLVDNGFVARPGDEREFYALYEKLRYRERPQYVTADAVLQVYRDEFLELLESAEEDAAEVLAGFSSAMANHYRQLAESDPTEQRHYLAVYFTVADVLLTSAGEADVDDNPYIDQYPPVPEQMPDLADELVEELPETLDENREFRDEVAGYIDSIFAHEGIANLEIPSIERAVRVDFSQFRLRGPYEGSELGGYFKAMQWYGHLPVPFDESVIELLEALESVEVGDGPALEAWREVDEFVAGFMGRPTGGHFGHLAEIREKDPDPFDPFDVNEVGNRLDELVGEVGIRDADAVAAGGDEPPLSVKAFPNRAGLDSEFFTDLSHPNVEGRGMVRGLDAMAAFGNDRARKHAIEGFGQSAEGEGEALEGDAEVQRREYVEQLDELVDETPAAGDEYWSTDVYHSWLAVLATLADVEDVPDDSIIDFVDNDAWQDRKLSSALGGYAQLKHASVLYAAQSMAAECGADMTYYVMVEQPIEPTPHGYVDPMPTFFERLEALAEQAYEMFDVSPGVRAAGSDNAAGLAGELAEIARDQVEGRELTEEQLGFIELVGRELEELTLRTMDTDALMGTGDSGRSERGIVFTIDVHTNAMSGKVRQLGVGRIDDLFVAVPDGVGRTMTQGGIFSYYEFTQPMGERMTDEEWAELVEAGELPDRPEWTDSFLERP